MLNAPKDVIDFLNDVVKLASANNMEVFVVGGLIRDSILEIENKSLDIDLLINYDIKKFKKIFDAKFNYNLEIRKNFLTTSYKTESGSNIDFVQTRSEIYKSPGSLPTVKPSDFNKDLKRRDFTINTLRAPLSDFLDKESSLIDIIVENKVALEDLKSRTIRILHEKSFLDDPTRILRAIKYKVKINGLYELETKKLIQVAIKDDYLKYISNFRSLNEFLKILLEKDYKDIILEMINLNLKLPYFDISKYKLIIEADNFDFSESRIKAFKFLAPILNNDYLNFLNDLNVSKKERKELLS